MNELVGSGTTVAWIYIDTHYDCWTDLSFSCDLIVCLLLSSVDAWCYLLIGCPNHNTHNIRLPRQRQARRTSESARDARERHTHTHRREGERETRRTRWRLKRENKQQRLGRNSYTFCAGMGADFPTLLHKQHSWNFCPIPLRVAQQIWDFTTVQIPHPLPPSPAFFFFLFFFISGFSFLFS